MKNVTLVLGASLKEVRYSNIAIRRLRSKEIPVVAVGFRTGAVADVKIETEKIQFQNIETVTLYLNPKRQVEYYHYIINLKPRRVIFNPGTENFEFIKLLKENGIESEVACTLVLLSTNQYYKM
ncbi:CoA-binding protein [Polaribacter aquimarinus]|uniref:CoA-binding protein n=1 Tax=Polaribacter aquimarinus TaxID=2100726 RepID=A0A2U2JDI0_9FLAO|nr:CoA-binding protein [Polaribacter aquimarinus]PWG06398.1 CoA-binding protein [Polaribacter aquimarinus]